jgi:hypothetical protein
VKVRHTRLFADRHVISAGVEAAARDYREESLEVNCSEVCPADYMNDTSRYFFGATVNEQSQQAYLVDEMTTGPLHTHPRLTLQGGVFVQRNVATLAITEGLEHRSYATTVEGVKTYDPLVERTTVLSPRVGFVLRFGPSMVRTAYADWVKPRGATDTLSNIGTAGVPLDDTLLLPGGRLKTLRTQFEWEVSPASTFVTVFGERQRVRQAEVTLELRGGHIATQGIAALRSAARDVSQTNVAGLGFAESAFDRPLIDTATVSTVGLGLNQVMARQLSGHAEYRFSRGTANPGLFAGDIGTCDVAGDECVGSPLVPFLPDHLLSIGATWVSPARVYASVQGIYRSDRIENFQLDDTYTWVQPIRAADWAGRTSVNWESPNKQWSAGMYAADLFSGSYPVTYGFKVTFRH